MPFGGPSSAQVLKVVKLAKDGRSYPPLAATIFSADSRCERNVSRLFAAGMFFEKFQVPQKYGRNGATRPFGPAGKPCVQHCSATCGASRLATAQALGGFMISAPRPETSHLLFDASSHAGASGGKNFASLTEYSSAWRTASVFTVMSPLALTRYAPYALNHAPAVSTESVVWPRPMPNAKPAFWQASAALRNVSKFQLSAFGALPAG